MHRDFTSVTSHCANYAATSYYVCTCCSVCTWYVLVTDGALARICANFFPFILVTRKQCKSCLFSGNCVKSRLLDSRPDSGWQAGPPKTMMSSTLESRIVALHRVLGWQYGTRLSSLHRLGWQAGLLPLSRDRPREERDSHPSGAEGQSITRHGSTPSS